MKYNCLIVDDEPLAHKILEKYIGKLDKLTVVHNCYSAIEAINYLHQNKVDILFLDINMPELTGLEMLKTLNNPPAVILTTAYSEFALEGYEFGVLDYLLKPIRFDRFLKAINRFFALESTTDTKATPTPQQAKINKNEASTSFFVKADGVQHKIEPAHINYIEAYGNFVKIQLGSQQLLTASTMTKMMQKLDSDNFVRIHKSFIVNLEKIEKLEGNRLIIDAKKLPIGTSYKQIVLQKIGL